MFWYSLMNHSRFTKGKITHVLCALPWPLLADLEISWDVFLARVVCFDLQCACSWKQESLKSHARFCITGSIMSAVSSRDHWSQASPQNKYGHRTSCEQERRRNLAVNPLPLICSPHPFFWLNPGFQPWDYPAGCTEFVLICLTYSWLPPSYLLTGFLVRREIFLV